jgi:hypothetical protein
MATTRIRADARANPTFPVRGVGAAGRLRGQRRITFTSDISFTVCIMS